MKRGFTLLEVMI
ncbi:prepilin-type N-terminal cleavage/methylation domain-containing protein, partial [Escherichia coli]